MEGLSAFVRGKARFRWGGWREEVSVAVDLEKHPTREKSRGDPVGQEMQGSLVIYYSWRLGVEGGTKGLEWRITIIKQMGRAGGRRMKSNKRKPKC